MYFTNAVYVQHNLQQALQRQPNVVAFNAAPQPTNQARAITKASIRSENVPVVVRIPTPPFGLPENDSLPSTLSAYNMWQSETVFFERSSSSTSSSCSSSSWSTQSSASISPPCRDLQPEPIGTKRHASACMYREESSIAGKMVKTLPSDKIAGEKAEYVSIKCMERVQRLKTSNKVMVCTFCKTNKEKEHIYKSHTLKDLGGKTVCPLLRLYTCPICGESGDQAHTITYCKKFKSLKRNQLISQ